MIAEDYNMTNQVGMKTGELSLTVSGSGGKSVYQEWVKQAYTEGVNDCTKKLPYINPYNCVEECQLYGAYLEGYNSVSEE
jgi:hypothetical protein